MPWPAVFSSSRSVSSSAEACEDQVEGLGDALDADVDAAAAVGARMQHQPVDAEAVTAFELVGQCVE